MGNRKRLIYSLFTIALIAIILIGINQIFISDYIFRSIMRNHNNTMKSVLSISKTGIYQYLSSLKSNIETLTDQNDIMDFNENGKHILERFQLKYRDVFSNVTRIDEKGNIQYTVPFDEKAVGRNVLFQEHNKKLFRLKIPIISAPFDAVQGYKAIAIAIPVFRDSIMIGSVTGLIPFDVIWDLYISRINIMEKSLFIVCDNDGNIIYGIGGEWNGNIDNLKDIEYSYTFSPDTGDCPFISEEIVFIPEWKGEYAVIADKMDINGNTWHIISLTSTDDLKLRGINIASTQRVFTYIIIILFVLLSAIFLIIYSMESERMSLKMRNAMDMSIKMGKEKQFFEDVLNNLLAMKQILIIIIDAHGGIHFISRQYKYINDNFYKLIDNKQAEKIRKNIEFSRIAKQGFMSILNLGNDKSKNRFLFSITPVSMNEDEYSVLIGFPYNEKMPLATNDMSIHILEWFNSGNPKALLDTSGNIIIANNMFTSMFRQNTASVWGNESKRVINAIKCSVNDIQDITLNIQYAGKGIILRISPIISPMLKVNYIAVDIQ